MKVIDLLNKIAYRETTYDYIEYWNRNKDKYDVMLVCEENLIYKLNNGDILLTDEVNRAKGYEEEPQEHKIPEKIEICYSPDIEEEIFYEKGNKPNHYVLGDKGTKLIINKINEILDYLEKKE